MIENSISTLITNIVNRLKTVEGVQAVVLGGSRAGGTHIATSDIDLGIYYDPSTPMDLAALSKIATEIDDLHRENLITDIGGWGPWINGGGWLTVHQTPVDFLYRDLDKVSRIIQDCIEGRIEIAYQPGHPHAFTSSIYLAEVALCQPLWDPHGVLEKLKSRVQPYPSELKRALVRSFWWETDFSIGIAKKSIRRGDVSYAAGCCFRCVACLMQVLFAINEQYLMNEKGAVAIADGFKQAPVNLKVRVASAFERLNESPQGIESAIHTLQEILDECKAFVE
jgi:predicted nucleotidyltransferase